MHPTLASWTLPLQIHTSCSLPHHARHDGCPSPPPPSCIKAQAMAAHRGVVCSAPPVWLPGPQALCQHFHPRFLAHIEEKYFQSSSRLCRSLSKTHLGMMQYSLAWVCSPHQHKLWTLPFVSKPGKANKTSKPCQRPVHMVQRSFWSTCLSGNSYSHYVPEISMVRVSELECKQKRHLSAFTGMFCLPNGPAAGS